MATSLREGKLRIQESSTRPGWANPSYSYSRHATWMAPQRTN